jgi:hypothetical protein
MWLWLWMWDEWVWVCYGGERERERESVCVCVCAKREPHDLGQCSHLLTDSLGDSVIGNAGARDLGAALQVNTSHIPDDAEVRRGDVDLCEDVVLESHCPIHLCKAMLVCIAYICA